MFFILLQLSAGAQGYNAAIGDRTSLGVFGGPAADLTFTQTNFRLFAAIDGPGTLLFTEDTCKTWLPAFPFDSLEWDFGARGWGGGCTRVLTNEAGWVGVQTLNRGEYSSAVISFMNGNPGTFKTAFDPYQLRQLTGSSDPVSAIALSDHYLYIALGRYLARVTDTTTFGGHNLVVRVDSISGISPTANISSIALANSESGFPVYLVIESKAGNDDGMLYRYDGTYFEMITGLPTYLVHRNVFTHPALVTGNTCFVSCRNITNNEIRLFRTLTGGMSWADITPQAGTPYPLSDADYSPEWVPFMPVSQGLRLSIRGGAFSDNLGYNWSYCPVGPYPIATLPKSLDIVAGSTYQGVVISVGNIGGPFLNRGNLEFISLKINDFGKHDSHYYIATDAGLGYTSVFYNQTIPWPMKWQPPFGIFPIPGVGDERGVTAVAVDPADNLHVIAGHAMGFSVSFYGPDNFITVTPTNWNSNAHFDPTVTDIVFVTSDIILAVTGYKLREVHNLASLPVGNIWRSTNGGYSWYLVTPYTPNEFQQGNCLYVKDNIPSQVELYAGSGYNRGSIPSVNGAFWKSIDYGETWFKYKDGPMSGTSIMPILDIDYSPYGDDFYVAADKIFAQMPYLGSMFYNLNIPPNTGTITSSLIPQVYNDSILVSAGRNIYKLNLFDNQFDLKFRGMPGELINTLEHGSTAEGSNTGGARVKEATKYYLDIKVYIQGAYDTLTNQLQTSLNSLNFLPLSQPFNKAPWNYAGTETVATIPNVSVVDWVLVELRETAGDSSTATSRTAVLRRACFLLKDGTVTEIDGSSEPCFNFDVEEDLYSIIYSPGHVEVMSANALNPNAEAFAFNFTSGAGQVYGGSNGHLELEEGVWGMASGDGDGDGQVTNADKNEVWRPQSGFSGYYFGDFNRDGQVNNSDKIDFWEPNGGFGSQVP